ncbi:hypothetical protein OIDMADRAFT_32194 [Oidiodendron maius Zn]|uniref:Heterokaryon incompatibility domain-containing protein n=1 Tax=Oidiodendron maius (strain Zn) TaxID=913774 RepID=A0A0C3CE41_OIDMZ|nr:hypothetical protein OIDMADRAFT_32194 [Oidiodendron maius Zn]
MEPPNSLEELQNFLDNGEDVNSLFPALYGTGFWTLLQRAAFTGTSSMVSLLLEHGASIEELTEDGKSILDLACDTENWYSFELLIRAADQNPNQIKFFPSQFFAKLRDPFKEQIQSLSLKEFEDMVQHTKEVDLKRLIPYPDKNRHLIVLPKRIVDVGRLDQGLIKLAAGGRRRSPYCALSYRWQDTTIKTTAESLEAFRREIPLGTLQTQVRDACLIASRLGIRYVWIDALCIIQKCKADPGDFEEEAPKMAAVYGNATLTITFTDDVRLGTMVEPRHKSLSRELGDLDTRGWVLQEQILSQRVLYITRSGLFWECLEGSMSESCPCGIPEPTDDFRAIDDRQLKKLLFQKRHPLDIREKLMCMWRRNIVEEYTKRHLTYEEDRLLAVASITAKVESFLNDKCLVGIWKRDVVRSLVWHTAEPSSRPDNLVFPSWSWYSIKGPVVYSMYTPFDSHSQRKRSGYGLKDDMIADPDIEVLEISCQRDPSNSKVYRGCVRLRGLTLRAYFASGINMRLYLPRRRRAEQLIYDLTQGTLNPARHDGGTQPEHTYVNEDAFVDAVDFPGSKGYREVLCMLMGINTIDRAFPVALVLEKVNGKNEYQRVGTVAIDARQITVQASRPGVPDIQKHSDNMGMIQTVTII